MDEYASHGEGFRLDESAATAGRCELGSGCDVAVANGERGTRSGTHDRIRYIEAEERHQTMTQHFVFAQDMTVSA